ncbi:hypothetical protein PACTADRAFT_41524 [Pachysolen tannophilus NRRL Y-2460]|uniref:J domain-containing protein n=1 Tax=Pachysolen tannophilus NRRL Y-2460 TaxID=669874 RepID=A0A1E4TXH7_PACTA|nr:hypothetical protein PACTADRAFT_41524 [Pachysolen tannophilus NRRL Y-2460]
MGDSRYAYDENAQVWPYFVLSILIVITIPLFYSYIANFFAGSQRAKEDDKDYIKKKFDNYKTPIDKNLKKFESGAKKSKVFSRKFFVLCVLIVLISAVVQYAVSTSGGGFSSGGFDPFEILDISSSATEKEIKSHYRKLSLKFHPDKISRDTSEADKKELESRFVLINKAYKALTDEVTRANYEKYGHPDGPQQVTHGIALPKWFVEGQYSWILTLFYAASFVLLLPISVSLWWNNVKSYTKAGIHVDTAANFVSKLMNNNPAEVVKINTILKWISESKEFQLLYPNDSAENFYFLIQDYINRNFLEINSKDLDKTLRIVSMVPILIDGLIEIAATFRSNDIVSKAIETNKCIIQAVNPTVSKKYHHFLQLPYVELDKIDKKIECYTLEKFFNLADFEQKNFLNIQDDNKFQEIIEIGKKFPIIKLISAEFKVPGEKIVTPSSHAHLVLKILIKSPAQKGQIILNKESLIEEETLESLKNPFKIVSEQPPIPPTNAPFFPIKNRQHNGWYCSLILQRDNKLSDLPARITNLSFQNLNKDNKQFLNDGNLIVGTFKLQLQATTPPTIGEYHFRCNLKSLDYFGNDLDFPIKMKVEDPATLETQKTIFSDDEDEDEEENEDDSDFEQEQDTEESDFTDINTDTEDEG